MKKFMSMLFAGVVTLVVSGCGGGSGSSDYNDGLTTLFLLDQNSNSYADIPYICDSMSTWSQTAVNGEFSFYPGENCEFDFYGLVGNYSNDPYVDDIVYIVDDLDYGKGGIPYECVSFGIGSTYTDGSFDYDINDQCVFYL